MFSSVNILSSVSRVQYIAWTCMVWETTPLVTPSSLRLCTRPLRHRCRCVHLFNSLLWADSCPQKLIGWRATPSVTVLGDGALRRVVKVKWGRLGGTWVREDWCPCKVSSRLREAARCAHSWKAAPASPGEPPGQKATCLRGPRASSLQSREKTASVV